MPLRFIREFLRLESFSGISLCAAALLGLLLTNSSAGHFYQTFLYHPLHVSLNSLALNSNVNFIINDGLMTLFFLLVGLELKREILTGELNTTQRAILPAIAAIGGMLAPAVIFVICNLRHPSLLRGWAIPTATDIAFALGILSLLGKRIPLSLKVFLTALAIFDDLGAILIIAVFYTKKLGWYYLLLTTGIFSLLCICNHLQIKNFITYSALGILLWVCLLRSGIHPTIAGVLLALTIPLNKHHSTQTSPLYQMEHALHPWVSFFVLPLFAFANSGISFSTISLPLFFHSLPLGIILGLFIGKQLGIFTVVKIAVRMGWATLPSDCNWRMFYGMTLLCGIGFTMSLFIGDLAFDNVQTVNLVRLGVFSGSVLSGICGYFFLRCCAQPGAR